MEKNPLLLYTSCVYEKKDEARFGDILFENYYKLKGSDEAHKARTYSYETIRHFLSTFYHDNDIWLEVTISKSDDAFSYTIFDAQGNAVYLGQLLDDELDLVKGSAQ